MADKKDKKDRDSSDDEEEKTIADDVVVTKYKMSGDMANSKKPLSYFLLFQNVNA